MQIVIDIPKKVYKAICDKNALGCDISDIKNIIRDGTPLSKGHGRLIDADAFQKSYCDSNCGNRKCVDAMDKCIFIGDLQDAPTVIEADKKK